MFKPFPRLSGYQKYWVAALPAVVALANLTFGLNLDPETYPAELERAINGICVLVVPVLVQLVPNKAARP